MPRSEAERQKTCATCGVTFQKDPRNTWAYWERAKYCGQACAGAAKTAEAEAARKPMSDLFDMKVDRSGDCWLWTGLVDKDGYGLFPYARHQYRAHSVALTLDGRPVPSGMYACHTCDNPRCVRPSHLYAGTPLQNMTDAVERGRTRRGSSSHAAKLTEDQVAEIKKADGTHDQLAARYSVSRPTISLIKGGKTWRHV